MFSLSHRRTKTLAIVALVMIALTLLFIPQVSYKLSFRDQSALMVFKLPRSGSTWLTENLNRFDHVTIMLRYVFAFPCCYFAPCMIKIVVSMLLSMFYMIR